jgi:hypothetical protein
VSLDGRDKSGILQPSISFRRQICRIKYKDVNNLGVQILIRL